MQHLEIIIDFQSSIPVYRQIANAIRRLLVEGALPSGHRLPPVRQLAIDLELNLNTIAQAYRVLAEEGWLDLKQRSGATVIDRTQPAKPPLARRRQSLRMLRELAAELRASGIPPKEIAAYLRDLSRDFEPV